MRVGFLGCGKIGRKMLNELLTMEGHEVSFIQYIVFDGEAPCPVVSSADEALLKTTDLVIESATSAVLKANIDSILKHCDLMLFSVTAFADQAFYDHVKALMAAYGHRVFLPHGAILGIDGIADGRELITSVSIETTKSPASLGRTDETVTVLYEGSTRGACEAYPRNVNVHAAVALAGIGFDKTQSRIIADPSVNTNTHKIIVDGEGIHFELNISSFSTGGVTGKYTPYSAVASMKKVLGGETGSFLFV